MSISRSIKQENSKCVAPKSGGAKHITSPTSKSGGTCPPAHPMIDAHDGMTPALQFISSQNWCKGRKATDAAEATLLAIKPHKSRLKYEIIEIKFDLHHN